MAREIKDDLPLSPDIARYSSILSKDPNSMAFAPLAEAYRKAGMLDEAIATAQDGLRLHPNYVSGMVALGRAYYEKGMLKEAEEEMGKVVSMAPDNLIAKSILEEIKKQWPVVSGQGPEAEIEAKAGEVKIEERAEEAVPQVELAAPAIQQPVEELEPEGLEASVELEEVPEIEEIEAEEAGHAFGDEITEELWTGEAIPESERAEEEKAGLKKEITTETIAELYIKQGYIDKAIDIYQTIHDAHPDNLEIKRKLDELKGKVEAKVEEERAEAPITPTPSAGSGQALSPEGRVGEEAAEDKNVRRLKSWLETIQKERRKV